MLLEEQWKPADVCNELKGIAEEEVLAAIVRITGGDSRLIYRLLTQAARAMKTNGLQMLPLSGRFYHLMEF